MIQPEAVPDAEAQPAAVDPEQVKRSQQAAALMTTGSGNPSDGILPFPDARGNPIPATATSPTVLPFPDQFGNPIPVKPWQGGSPFPANPSKPNTGSSTQQ